MTPLSFNLLIRFPTVVEDVPQILAKSYVFVRASFNSKVINLASIESIFTLLCTKQIHFIINMLLLK
jgi:hypothetical protein